LHAREALAGLPAQHPWRVIAFWALAEAQERSAPIADAIASLREACGSAGAAARSVFTAMLDVSLAWALNLHGKRREALEVCRQSLTRDSDTPGRPTPLAVLTLARLAVLHYEANDLAQASDCLRQGQALAGQLALDDVFAMLDGITAMLHAARGEMDAALSQVQQALQHAPPGNLSDVTWISAIEARVHLRRGNVLAAQRWADSTGLSQNDPPSYMNMEQHCAYAWLLMAHGRLTEAEHWLARLEQFVVGRGYTRWLITLRVLQALIAERARDTSRANVCMAEALQLAAPEGYRRAFLDEDPQVMVVLQRVRASAPDFVDALLHGAGRQARHAGPSQPPAI
jgi:LuxR family maltose regulon positive regulatory protein